jgi:hypothetical protein
VKVRLDLTENTHLEWALHDTFLQFNGDLADCMITIGANADITFKPCQLPSPARKVLEQHQSAVEIDLSEFLRLLCGMVQIIDGHVHVRGPRADGKTILDIRVVDSSFALIETDDQLLLETFQSLLRGERSA